MWETRYRILKKLAEGGSGTTYLVWDSRLERKWVMKQVLLTAAGQREAVQREMAALRRLRHPGIPVLADAFYEADSICLIVEYMEGMTLEERIRLEGAMEVQEAIWRTLQAGRLLEVLHRQTPPLLHGDLKPSNLVIQGRQMALLDFGAAGNFPDGRGSGWYTPGYGAPELAYGEAATVQSDIYSLGAVLFYLLTGQAPSDSRGIYPVREQDASLPAWLEGLILCCTDRQPQKRYGSVTEVLEELDRGLCRKEEKGIRSLWNRYSVRKRTFRVRKNIVLTEGRTYFGAL